MSHTRMTGILSERLALRYGLPERAARHIRLAAGLHDIGKYKIPQSILDKPGKLTDEEYEIVKLHTVYGYALLETLRGSVAYMARLTAMYHHERYDGRGYWGIESERQPVFVRIVTLADVYTALISERVYKRAWSVKEAVEYIGDNAGSQFDPRLTGVFIPLARDFDFTGLGVLT